MYENDIKLINRGVVKITPLMVNYHRVGCESTLFSISLTFEQQLVHANRVRILVIGGQVRNKLCSRHAQMFTGPLPLSRDALVKRNRAEKKRDHFGRKALNNASFSKAGATSKKKRTL